MPTIRIQDKNNNITLSRGLICIIYARNRPIGYYPWYIAHSAFVSSLIKNLIATSSKPLKIPFQRILQIQNRPNGSRDICPTRAGKLRKEDLRWISDASDELQHICQVSSITESDQIKPKFDEESNKTNFTAL